MSHSELRIAIAGCGKIADQHVEAIDRVPGSRIVALLQCLTGIWLMYCTWAVTVNLALGYKLWI